MHACFSYARVHYKHYECLFCHSEVCWFGLCKKLFNIFETGSIYVLTGYNGYNKDKDWCVKLKSVCQTEVCLRKHKLTYLKSTACEHVRKDPLLNRKLQFVYTLVINIAYSDTVTFEKGQVGQLLMYWHFHALPSLGSQEEKMSTERVE